MSADLAERVMDVDAARRLTERIRITAANAREALEKLPALVEEARDGNAHVALGYPSWTAYLADVLGAEPLRLPRDQRREIVGYLSGEGLSTRAIAPIVGASVGTVHTDREVFRTEHLAAPAPAALPAPPQTPPGVEAPPAQSPEPVQAHVEPTATSEAAGDSTLRPAATITGLDGKTYTRPEPDEPSKARRRAITDTARDAGWDLRKAADRIQRIADDDRFARNKEEVATHLRSHLLHTVEVCQDLLDRL